MLTQLSRPIPQDIPRPLSASASPVAVSPGDKWILAGSSGSGKTVALKYLDAAYRRIYPGMRHFVLDSKFQGDFDDWPGRVQQDTAPGKPGNNQRYQVWQPIKLIPDEIEKWLWMILHGGPSVLAVDELVHLCYGRGVYSDQYNTILKTGRGLKIGVITLSQEFSHIPPNAYNESNHRLGFYIEGRYNRMIRNDLMKYPVENPPDLYGFYYQHRNGRGEPRYHSDIQHFLGAR